MTVRQFIRPAALLIACGIGLTPAFAQSADQSKQKTEKKETIIVQKSNKKGNTEIVIRDGCVFVNGEKIADVQTGDKGEVKKIIISGEPPYYTMRNDDAPMPPRKAMLGVMTDPTSEKAGALVRGITPGSAAEKAGLKKGDLITSVDGKAVKDAKNLAEEIGEGHEPGDKVSIQYQRDGKSHTTDANLMAANMSQMREFHIRPGENFDMPNFMHSLPFMADESFEPTPKLGLSVEDRADGDGVRVLSVNPGSPAAQAGIKEGDVITKLNQEKLGSVDELQMMMRGQKPGEKLNLEYQRSGKSSSVNVVLPKPLKKKDL
jgi:predicted metalloprotease with PDZ domain